MAKTTSTGCLYENPTVVRIHLFAGVLDPEGSSPGGALVGRLHLHLGQAGARDARAGGRRPRRLAPRHRPRHGAGQRPLRVPGQHEAPQDEPRLQDQCDA